MTEAVPFFQVSKTTRNWPEVEDVIVAGSGVILPREAALALHECYRVVLEINEPPERWAPFLPKDPEVVRADFRALGACLAELGWEPQRP